MIDNIRVFIMERYSMWLFSRIIKRMGLLGYSHMQLCADGGQVRAVTFSQSKAYVDEQVKAIPRFIYD